MKRPIYVRTDGKPAQRDSRFAELDREIDMRPSQQKLAKMRDRKPERSQPANHWQEFRRRQTREALARLEQPGKRPKMPMEQRVACLEEEIAVLRARVEKVDPR